MKMIFLDDHNLIIGLVKKFFQKNALLVLLLIFDILKGFRNLIYKLIRMHKIQFKNSNRGFNDFSSFMINYLVRIKKDITNFNKNLIDDIKILNILSKSELKRNVTFKNIKKFSYKINMDSKNYFLTKKIQGDIILTPKEGYNSVLIFMHGLGDSADGYYEFFSDEYRPIPKKMKIVLLTAPKSAVTINGGYIMNSWYDILSLSNSKGAANEIDVKKNSERIKKVIEEEVSSPEIGNNYKKVFLGGFSQGCCMALYVGLSINEELGGIIGLSGMLFPFITVNENKKSLPIFISHGLFDGVIPFEFSNQSYGVLRNIGFNTKFHSFDGDHTIDLSTIDKMKDFLTDLTSKF